LVLGFLAINQVNQEPPYSFSGKLGLKIRDALSDGSLGLFSSGSTSSLEYASVLLQREKNTFKILREIKFRK
jgi:hypothetical protein